MDCKNVHSKTILKQTNTFLCTPETFVSRKANLPCASSLHANKYSSHHHTSCISASHKIYEFNTMDEIGKLRVKTTRVLAVSLAYFQTTIYNILGKFQIKSNCFACQTKTNHFWQFSSISNHNLHSNIKVTFSSTLKFKYTSIEIVSQQIIQQSKYKLLK